MRDDYEHSAPGLIGWVLIVLFALFLSTKSLWFNQIQPADKALFWTNVAVAIGTLALALVTFLQVRETKALLISEDTRHQQDLAPIVKFVVVGTSHTIHEIKFANIGLGPALNIEANGEGVYRVVEFESAPGNILNKKITRDENIDVKPAIKLSAIGAGTEASGRTFNWERDHILSMRFLITYTDVFGNKYETVYDDFKTLQFEYRPPRKLFKNAPA